MKHSALWEVAKTIGDAGNGGQVCGRGGGLSAMHMALCCCLHRALGPRQQHVDSMPAPHRSC